MLTPRRRATVFAGGTLSGIPSPLLARIDLCPPARRGDLEALAEDHAPGTVLLLEGLFGGELAVSPMECRLLIEKGWTLLGAASIGALRASELWSLGMIGLGDIYAMYRLGRLRSDADVAVCYNPMNWRETTASIVHIRAVLAYAEQEGVLAGDAARRLLLSARALHWVDRSWRDVLDRWQDDGLVEHARARLEAASRDESLHPKMRDARLALHILLAHRWIAQIP